MPLYILIGLLALYPVLCFIQNMTFTWSSRSRNGGDPNYHRIAALCSNGVYYALNFVITIFIIKKLDNPWLMVLCGILYTVSAAEGSVTMMKWLIEQEKKKPKRSVATMDDLMELEKRLQPFVNAMKTDVLTIETIPAEVIGWLKLQHEKWTAQQQQIAQLFEKGQANNDQPK